MSDELTFLAAVLDRWGDTLARYRTLLKSTEEAEAKMLDRTMIIFGSGMNSGADTGDHSPKNLPLLVAGGRKHGRHLAHNPDKHPPLANVLLTLIQKMGVEDAKFADATGTLTGLV